MKRNYILIVILLLTSLSMLVFYSCAGDGSTLDPLGNPLGPPKISVTPGALNVEADSGQVTSFDLKIKNVGGFPLRISSIKSQQDWLTVGQMTFPVVLESADSVLVPVTIGKPDLPTNTYTGAIEIASNDAENPKLQLPVTLKVSKEVLLFAPTLSNIQSFIFTPVCTECHSGAGAPRGLQLTEGNSYGLLVNVRADEKPEFFRVEPFNPDDSYLIKKVEGTPDISGGRMPLNRPPLTADQIKVIRRWIANGAPDN
ncbi:MAG: hypothetical protein D6748_11040 [Calditrichaeota bacterium]|nr:MAG: hypothetical protein D6748_11040 [Calditrichota bacterium]